MSTIRDVAKKAGVSIATVSKVLSNVDMHKIPESTVNIVKKAAENLNYIVPENYRRRKSIACIINVTAEKNADSYYYTILEGIKQVLLKHNYSVDYVVTKYDFTGRKMKELLKNKIEGFILMTNLDEDVLTAVKQKTKNIVCIDTTLSEFDNIMYNRFEAGCYAMEYLIKNGHRKIAYIGSHMKTDYSLHFGRFDAYRVMLKRYNLETNASWMIDCKWTRDICFNLTKKLLESDKVPSAIFFASDYMAIAGIDAIKEMGKTIPGDISIIGISDIDEAQGLDLTTIGIPKIDIGRITAQTLLARINGDDTIAKQIYVCTKLIERSSVRNIGKNKTPLF